MIDTQQIPTIQGVNELNQRKIKSSNLEIINARALKKNQERSIAKSKLSYSELLKRLKGTGKLWEDPDFSADSSSIFKSRQSPNYRQFRWKRPGEISNNPKFFTAGASRFDIKQGELGDCWILAALASLTMYESLFKNVVPYDQDFESNYIGAFRFHFWRFGQWREVIVDDRLPTDDGDLVYMYSAESNEFWTALLEKAYAKMCGTYEALIGGNQSESMEDFTGGLCEVINLRQIQRPAALFKEMSRFLSQATLMCCDVEGNVVEGLLPNGLITFHVYSVTNILEINLNNRQKRQLIRLRNPWGNTSEWNGKWNDNSSEWNSVSSDDKNKYCGFQGDGEFWMSFDDFLGNFTNLEVCHLGPESFDNDFGGKKRWEMSILEGAWIKNVSAGGCRNNMKSFYTNPQFRIEITDPDEDDQENTGTVIIGLMQKDMRKRNLDFHVIGYVIYPLNDPNVGILGKNFFSWGETISPSNNYINQREICDRHKLSIGHYVIVPSTFDRNQEAQFIMRIFTQKPNNPKALDATNSRIDIATHLRSRTMCMVKDNLENELQIIFEKITGPTKVINSNQLNIILNAILAKDSQCVKMKDFNGFSLDACRSMMALYDYNHTGKMEFNEFVSLFKNLRIWKTAFKNFDADDNGVFDAEEYRNALTDCGFSVSNSLFKVLANRYSDSDKGIITFEDFIMSLIRLTHSFETMESETMEIETINPSKQFFYPVFYKETFLHW